MGLCRSRRGGGAVGVIKGRDEKRERKKNAMRKEKKNK